MKKLVALALAVVLMALLTACGGAVAKSGDTAAMPASSKDLKGQNYQDVVTRLQSAGFTNVTTATIDDLIVGWLTKDGEVEKVAVNGATDFQANITFPKDAEVVITYHTFPATTTTTDGTTTSAGETTTTTIAETSTTTTAQTTTTTIIETTTTMAGAGLALVIEATSPVSQGSSATVRARTTPGADCSIVVMYKTGPSTADGLEPKQADRAGNVSWTWDVGPNTSTGEWPISVTASIDGQSVTQETSFVVQ